MQWPMWIPYPICWIRAFVIAVINGIGWRLVGSSGEPAIVILLAPLPLLGIVFSHHLVYGRHGSGWRPQLESWWEGFYGYMVMICSAVVSAAIGILFLGLSNLWGTGEAAGLMVLYLFVASSLYQMEHLIRSRPPLTIYKRGSVQSPSSFSAFQDIEKDLERIKKQGK